MSDKDVNSFRLNSLLEERYKNLIHDSKLLSDSREIMISEINNDSSVNTVKNSN